MTEPNWPSPSDIACDVPLPEGVRIRQLARADVPALIATLEAWQPELRLLDHALLTPEFFAEAAAFAGEDPSPWRRPVLVLAFDGADGPVAVLVLSCELRNFLACDLGEGTLELRLSAVHPQLRGRGLELALVEAAVRVARATRGISLLYVYSALDERDASALLERAGFRPWGVLPNGGLQRLGSALLHVPQAMWIKLLIPPEHVRWPQPEQLRPRTAALVQLLSGQGEITTPSETTAVPLPELDGALAARLAARPGGRDTWPDIGMIAASLALPPGVVVRQLARADLPKVLACLPVWYPPLLHSTTDFLTAESYERVALAGEEARVDRRPGFALVAEVDGELAVFASYTFRAGRSRRLKAELAVVNPDHRRKNLSNQLTPLWVLIARALEADTIVGWATLSHPHTQLACERQGLALVGIMPTERHVDAQGVTRIVCEALYAASLVPDEQRRRVPLEAMPESVAALAHFVLGERTHSSWPLTSTLVRALALPGGLQLRKLCLADLPSMLASLAAWQPELVAADPALLEPDTYRAWVALEGETSAVDERPMLVLVFERADGPVAWLALAYDMRGHALLLRALAVHPEHRDGELPRRVLAAAILVGQALGIVDTVHALTDLDDRQACADLEQTGFQLWGLLPNVGRRSFEGALRLVPCAMWAKTIVRPRDLLWPTPTALRPRTAVLMQRLFGSGDEASIERDGLEREPASATMLAACPGDLDTWPDIGELASALALPEGVVVRQLARGDIPWVGATLPVWYPELTDAMLKFILAPEFLEHAVALAGEESGVDQRPYFAFVMEADGEPRAFGLCSFDTVRARMLRAEFLVVDPRHRGRSLATHLMTLHVRLARALAAEVFVIWVTLAHPYLQRVCEQLGIDLAGISPASERFVAPLGGMTHAFEAFYAVSLLPDDRRAWPPLDAMPERVAALVRFVHGRP